VRTLVAAWHWAVLLARGRRCWACSRLYLLHLPWQVAACKGRPLRLSFVRSKERQEVA
jgi:hypothetical protein